MTHDDYADIPGALFRIRALKITDEAQALFERLNQSPLDFLIPHVKGEYNHMGELRAGVNWHNAKNGYMFAAWYEARDGTVVWVITDDSPERRTRMMIGPSERWNDEESDDEG